MGGGFGGSLASAGDQNGDGFADWLMSDDLRAFVFLGALDEPGEHAFVLDSAPDSTSYMRTLANAGDVNGDGCPDILVGEPREGMGKVELFAGCAIDDSEAEPGWAATNPGSGATDGGSAPEGGVDGGDLHDAALGDASSPRDAGPLTEGARDGMCSVGTAPGRLGPTVLGLALLALVLRRRFS